MIRLYAFSRKGLAGKLRPGKGKLRFAVGLPARAPVCGAGDENVRARLGCDRAARGVPLRCPLAGRAAAAGKTKTGLGFACGKPAPVLYFEQIRRNPSPVGVAGIRPARKGGNPV